MSCDEEISSSSCRVKPLLFCFCWTRSEGESVSVHSLFIYFSYLGWFLFHLFVLQSEETGDGTFVDLPSDLAALERIICR